MILYQKKNKSNKLIISNQGEVNIDINVPDNNGVSHNQFLRFNTRKGITVQLNNDSKQNKNMLTLGSQSAKLIINQVNSTEKTNLHGLLEIKGSPAKLLLLILMASAATIANLAIQLALI